MKRLYFITCIIVLSCVVASSFIIPVTGEGNSDVTGRRINSEDIVTAEYTITGSGDRIVVYKGNSDKPYIETDTAVSSLPMDVQAKLLRGIRYPDEASMKKALVEFCS